MSSLGAFKIYHNYAILDFIAYDVRMIDTHHHTLEGHQKVSIEEELKLDFCSDTTV